MKKSFERFLSLFIARNYEFLCDENNRETLTSLIIQAIVKNKEKCDKYKIDIIYSSPYVRTLQTIYPYAIYFKKKVNIIKIKITNKIE